MVEEKEIENSEVLMQIHSVSGQPLELCVYNGEGQLKGETLPVQPGVGGKLTLSDIAAGQWYICIKNAGTQFVPNNQYDLTVQIEYINPEFN